MSTLKGAKFALYVYLDDEQEAQALRELAKTCSSVQQVVLSKHSNRKHPLEYKSTRVLLSYIENAGWFDQWVARYLFEQLLEEKGYTKSSLSSILGHLKKANMVEIRGKRGNQQIKLTLQRQQKVLALPKPMPKYVFGIEVRD